MFCTYSIEKIDDDCYDLYVSDDDGYTWEFYNWYDSYDLADATGRIVAEEMEAGFAAG